LPANEDRVMAVRNTIFSGNPYQERRLAALIA
jgi:hypothetical protein